MALDEAIVRSVIDCKALPTLRLFGWDKPSVSLGCFQKISDLHLEYCRTNAIPIVRRPTGGRAILHGNELTYSVSVRTDSSPFDRGLLESYRTVSAAFMQALKDSGIDAEMKLKRERGRILAGSPLCFRSSSYGELLSADRKIVGSAQRRLKEGFLQQGSIPYSSDREKMRGIWGLRAVSDQLAALSEIKPDFNPDFFRNNVLQAFEETFGISLLISQPEAEELQFARELEQQKYRQDSWNLRL